jgi:vancomycin aglycone glucosyltransferase
MRIVMAAGGSRGDVQPMIALALRLRERGHDIELCAPPNFTEWIAGHGLSVHALGGDIQAFLGEVGLDMNRALAALRNDIRGEFARIAQVVGRSDLIVGASVTCAGSSHAEKLGIPYCYVMFSPSLLPSAFHPAPTCPYLHLPRWVNRFTGGQPGGSGTDSSGAS